MSTRRHLRIAGITAALSIAAGILFPSSAQADRYSLRARMARANAAAERSGYSCRNAARVVNLAQGYSYVLDTTLFRRSQYRLIGVGDDSVRDLDLALYDENWNLISRDAMADNTPIVHVTPRWTGTFHYKIIMTSGAGLATALICYRR